MSSIRIGRVPTSDPARSVRSAARPLGGCPTSRRVRRRRGRSIQNRPSPSSRRAIALPRAPFLIMVVGLVIAGVPASWSSTPRSAERLRSRRSKARQAALNPEEQLNRDLAEAESPEAAAPPPAGRLVPPEDFRSSIRQEDLMPQPPASRPTLLRYRGPVSWPPRPTTVFVASTQDRAVQARRNAEARRSRISEAHGTSAPHVGDATRGPRWWPTAPGVAAVSGSATAAGAGALNCRTPSGRAPSPASARIFWPAAYFLAVPAPSGVRLAHSPARADDPAAAVCPAGPALADQAGAALWHRSRRHIRRHQGATGGLVR
jgi:hypothetical protein